MKRREYLREVAAEHDSYKVQLIRPLSRWLAAVAPAELSDLIWATLVEKRERGVRDRAFSFADSNYLPPSPAQQPFLDLLEASPQHGLALVRKLVSAAVEYPSNGANPGTDGFTLVFDDAPRFFPWTNTYLWSRNQGHDYSAASGLMALEAWSHNRLDAGEPIETVLADTLGPEGCCAAYLLVAVDLLISHFPTTRNALIPFLACPELLATDRVRVGMDEMDHGGTYITRDEPAGRIKLADLQARPSRRKSLDQLLPAYLTDEPASNWMRAQLRTAVEALGDYKDQASFHDPSFMGAHALNVLDPNNWEEVDGVLAYRLPAEQAAHVEQLRTHHEQLSHSNEIEVRIQLAIGGPQDASLETSRDAVESREW